MDDLLLKLFCIFSIFTDISGVCNLAKDSLTLTDWSGSLNSPGYLGGSYPNNQDCTWNIRVSKGSRIKLDFTLFQLEDGVKSGDTVSTCYDKVQIRDGTNVLLEACGSQLTSPILSNTNEIQINFKSDESGNKAGFRLEYHGECSMDIAENSTIETPNFPKSPPDSIECKWNINVPKATVAVIQLNNQANTLPSCNISPLTVTETKNDKKKNKLCLIESKILIFNDAVFTYDVTPDSVPWNGSMKVEYIKNPQCEYFCVNSVNCLNPRLLNTERYRCSCQEGFTGRNCDVRIEIVDPCYPKSCQNNGTCVQVRGAFTCNCPVNFTGETCEAAVDPCFPDSCMNGGTCENAANSYICSCPEGFSGKRCQTKDDPCEENPCQNSGTCFSKGDQFRCECLKGFIGKTCHIEYDMCSSRPCPENATCVSLPASYKCKCPAGYSGDACEINMDGCTSDPCKNGKCIDADDTFKCICDDGYSGPLCDIHVDYCAESPCVNGICENTGSTFKCVCDIDYIGRYCSIHKDAGHCLEARDDIVTSRILWFDILANSTEIQSCPQGIMGNASRSCVMDSSSPTGGVWTRPDLSECVSPEFLEIAIQATLLKSGNDLTVKSLAEITSNLENITSAVRDPTAKTLYPGDLRMATTVVSLITDGLGETNAAQGSVWHIAQGVKDAMDNIIDPDTKVVWQNARANVVVDRMKSVLESSEKLAEYFKTGGLNTQSARSLDSGDQDEPNDLRLVGRNMELQISTVGKDEKEPDIFIGGDSSSIVLPPAVIQLARQYNDESPVSFYYARFSSMADLLSMKEERYGENVSESIVNSDIISSKVLGFPEDVFNKIAEPVIITYKTKNSGQTEDHVKNHCVFMNMNSTSSKEEWSTEGCLLKDSNSTHVICYCYHLTNFALLLDVYKTSEELDETNDAVLSYISYIGGSLSILGCLVSIIVFEYFRLKSDRVRIHEQLAASIILVQVIFLIGIGRTSDKTSTPVWACKTVAILLHYTLTALFCWMLVEGIHLYVVLVQVFQRGSHLKKYMALGWGAPLVIVGISVGVFYPDYGQGRICWLARDLLFVCFVPSVGLVVVINTVMLIITIRVMMKSMNSTSKVNVKEKSSIRISLKAAVVLLPLLGLTWTLAFFAINTDGTEALAYVFTYLFTIGNAFQGVVFFVFHCLMNVDVRSAFERRYRRKKSLDTSSSRGRKSSEMDSYIADVKGTMTPKFVGVVEKTNNSTVIDKPKINPNIHFNDFHDFDTDKNWYDDPFVLRLRPSSESDPNVSEYISDIEDYLEKPSRHSVHFSSNT
ncbi:cadherin EGF LAG seven-pass G-type receptor 3 [Patella vulgata]|uniref:cadherin EGF LAG seven-pass G-type receptor 3 n=1 Tax=Patella vulgata TaxID=6465 RepID=UPI00217F3A2F|nr:cadherin EGF LAG seven-pass G-type receptor 3 [Patella vulgata]XP_050415318.1 cadherin EGF LAG seven-pass G-type receptor 3 [Patella vulgata]